MHLQKKLYLVPLCLLCLLYTWKAQFFQIHDFANYYFGAYAILNGFFDATIFDALAFNEKLLQEGFDFLFVSYYPNTPFLAFSFIPLNLLDWSQAKFVLNLIGSGLFLFSLFRLWNHYKLPYYYLLLIPILFFIPIKNNLLFGQVYFFLFFLLAEGMILYEKHRKIAASFLWGIAVLLKVFPILLVFYFLFKRDFRGFVYFGLSCLLLLLISLPFCGVESWQYFITEVFPKSSAGIVYDGFTPKAKSALMLFKNLFVYDEMLNPNPWINNESLFNIVQLFYKVAILSVCAFVTIRYRQKAFIPFAFWLFASLLLSPTNSSYSKLFVIFPFVAILIDRKPITSFGFLLSLIFLFLISNLPLHYFYEFPLLLKFPRAYLMIGFFVLLYFQFQSKFQWKALFFLALLFSIQSILNLSEKITLPAYALSQKELPIMLTDFGEKEGKLFYKYWTAGGVIKEAQSDFLIEEINREKVSIVEGQIYLNGQQLTQSLDNKRQPKLINGKTVFYLSDANRGTGFYTLRKMPIP